jgi:hypothetical protein
MDSKLVYTSDKTDKKFFDNLQVGVQTTPKEILNEMSKEVLSVKKSLPNTKAGGKVRMRKQSEKSLDVIKRCKYEFSKLVNFLSTGQRSVNSLKSHLEMDGMKFSNFMQKSREASQNIIQNKNGFWMIIPGYASGTEKLIEAMVENRNAVFNNSLKRKKEREAQGIQSPRKRKVVPQHATKLFDPKEYSKHMHVEGKTIIQKFTSTGLLAELKIDASVHASINTHVSVNSLTIDIKW